MEEREASRHVPLMFAFIAETAKLEINTHYCHARDGGHPDSRIRGNDSSKHERICPSLLPGRRPFP